MKEEDNNTMTVKARLDLLDDPPKSGNEIWLLGRAFFLTNLINYMSLDTVLVFQEQLDEKLLKESLEITLTNYQPLTGRVIEVGRAVQLNNEGVAYSTCSLPEATWEKFVDSNDLSRKTPLLTRGEHANLLNDNDVMAGRAPLMSVKLTQLGGGGSLLGVAMSHAIVDAGAYGMFMKDWSNIYAQLASNSDRSAKGLLDSLEPIQPLPDFYISPPPEDVQLQSLELLPNMRRQSLVVSWLARPAWKLFCSVILKILPGPRPSCLLFQKKHMDALKAKAEAESGGWVSRNEALLAHVWSMLLDVAEIPASDRQDLVANMVCDPRSRVIPPRILGTAVGYCPVCVDMSRDIAPEVQVDQVVDSLPVNNNDSLFKRVHQAVRATLSNDVVTARLQLFTAAMPEKWFSTPGLSDSINANNLGCLTEWNNNAPILDYSRGRSGTFGTDLAHVETWHIGTPLQIVPRVNGDMEVWIHANSCRWAPVTKMGFDVFFDKLAEKHEHFCKTLESGK